MANNNRNSDKEGLVGDVDIKAILAKFITYWYLFVLGIAICLPIAFVAGVLTPQMWKVSGKILIDYDNNSSNSLDKQHSELSAMLTPKHNSQNDIEILKSRDLIRELVRKANLTVRTYQDLPYKSFEIFESSPFVVSVHSNTSSLPTQTYKIKVLNDAEYRIRAVKLNLDAVVKFGQSLTLGNCTMTISKAKNFQKSGNYSISVEPEDKVIFEFLSNFQASFPDKTSSTIDLSYNYSQPTRGEFILERLIELYINTSLQNKLRTADSTLKFIDGRLAIVSDDLNGVQRNFERFKQANNMVDIVEKSKSLVDKDNSYSGSLVQQEIQLSVVNDLLKYLSKPTNMAVPSNVGLNNGTLTSGIDNYNALVLNRDRLRLSLTDNNPVIQNLNKQMESTKTILVQSLESYKRNLVVARDQLSRQEHMIQGKIQDVPEIQRVYLDFTRQEAIKEELYSFLLQKREEVAISKTSTITNVQVIEHAKSASFAYEPSRTLFYIVGVFAGLLLPALYLGLKEFLNTRVRNKNDIERKTNIPIVGEISHKKNIETVVVKENSRTNISEQFRALRTNLSYLFDSSKPNVIMFTSSMSGEGKTFLSINLGSALALAGKKVVFLELDLRKPKISMLLGIDNSAGFSNFMISGQTDYTPFLKPTGFSDNCFLIPSGPIPPNPSELLINPKVELLIQALKKEFDYIIIDTAPVGLVTDALLLEKFSDVTLYVIRQDYTHKPQIDILNNLKVENKIKKPYIIFNGIKLKIGDRIYGYYGYNYGYGYGYGNGSGYTTDEKETGFLENLFTRKRKAKVRG